VLQRAARAEAAEDGWNVGYSARFTPKLELLDEHGNVVRREGDQLIGGCETPDAGVWSVKLPSYLLTLPTEPPACEPPNLPQKGASYVPARREPNISPPSTPIVLPVIQ